WSDRLRLLHALQLCELPARLRPRPAAHPDPVLAMTRRRAVTFAVFAVAVAGAIAASTAGGAVRNPPELITAGAINGNGANPALWQGSSQDGTIVFFLSQEQLAPTETDSFFDIYQRAGSTTTEVSLGPAGGNGTYVATYRGASADGSHVFFDTTEPLVASDTDTHCDDQDGLDTTCSDVYERVGNTTNLLSTGPTGGNGTFNARF